MTPDADGLDNFTLINTGTAASRFCYPCTQLAVLMPATSTTTVNITAGTVYEYYNQYGNGTASFASIVTSTKLEAKYKK